MFGFGSKKKQAVPASEPGLIWDEPARQAMESSLAQAPVPAMLKGKVKQELTAAAEAAASARGATRVTVNDVMAGFLNKVPAAMRGRIEAALQGGPEQLKALQKEIEDHK